MAKQEAQRQNNFTSGELSPLMGARYDLAKYHNGCRTLQNCIVLPHGGTFKRPGSEYMATTPGDGLVRLIRFVSSNTAAYVLEFSHQILRFYQTVSGSSGLVLDDDSTTVTSVPAPYTSAQLAALKVAGIADIAFIAHGSHKPRQLIRTDDNTWTLSAPEFLRGPFLTENDTTTTITIDGYTVDAVSAGAGGTFTISDDGDLTPYFAVGSVFTVHGSTNNDNTNFTVASTTYSDPDFVITVSETVGATGDGTIWPDLRRGNKVELTLSAASGPNDFVGFLSTHIGALMQVAFTKESEKVSGSFTSATSSDTINVALGQELDFSTDKLWTGTIALEVSYDSGSTYETVYEYGSTDSPNLQIHQTEDVADALYRVTMKAYTSGTCDYDLTTRQARVEGVIELDGVTSTTTASAIIRAKLARADTPTTT